MAHVVRCSYYFGLWGRLRRNEFGRDRFLRKVVFPVELALANRGSSSIALLILLDILFRDKFGNPPLCLASLMDISRLLTLYFLIGLV